MLGVLYESPAGYALFKLLDDSKISKPEDVWDNFDTVEKAKKSLKLEAFSKFDSTSKAVESLADISDGSLAKDLKKFLKSKMENIEKLAVADTKLGSKIAKKLGIKVVSDSSIQELYRVIRMQFSSLLEGFMGEGELKSMTLGLAHSMSRFKIKFSPDKVDTMIVQAIALLDDLDKELNTYTMRLREWYGWHFPELSQIITDGLLYAKMIKLIGFRPNIVNIGEEVVTGNGDAVNGNNSSSSMMNLEGLTVGQLADLKAAAEISMGTEISQDDLNNIDSLADQIISINAYRAELYEYLKNRMTAIAPNLTAMVGELVGARLISHAGSLINLAKCPASTVQILGAEKALFRALKTKHDTPKYGLIYHASLVGQANPKLKGKISRVLAAKTSLSIRTDALTEDGQVNDSMGVNGRFKVEARLRQLEAQGKVLTGASKSRGNQTKHEIDKPRQYNSKMDITKIEKKETTPLIKEKASEKEDDLEKSKKRKDHEKEEKKEKSKEESKSEKKSKSDKKEKSNEKHKIDQESSTPSKHESEKKKKHKSD